MAQYFFGSGALICTPTAAPPGYTTITPRQFGVLQDVTIDFNYTVKELYGLFQLPVAIGRGTAKVTGKARFGTINARAFNDIFFQNSVAPAAGQRLGVINSVFTGAASVNLPGTVPFTGFVDLGVLDNNGVPLDKVASAPATGQYAVNQTATPVVYSFNATDVAGAGRCNPNVSISYSYLPSSPQGFAFTINNQLLGISPTFGVTISGQYGGKNLVMTMNQAISSKLMFATKLEDFMVPELDFQCFVDGSQNLGTFSLTE